MRNAILFIFLPILSFSNKIEIDPKGYVMFCPCMGRFGNQVDQILGVMSFTRALDRTLVLPNFVEYKHTQTEMVPFEHIFQVSGVSKYLRVVTTATFIKHIMPSIWPKQNRTALCWSPRQSIFDSTLPPSCNAKEGSPFGPYWTNIGVDFVGDEYFGELPGGYDLFVKGSRQAWLQKFPAETHPVLAFSSAPAAFPSRPSNWDIQKYLKWTSKIVIKAKQFITDNLQRPFVAVHLRNDQDWNSVCDHVTPDRNQPLFASAQCLGEGHHEGTLTKEMCSPSTNTLLDNIVTEVGRLGAKSVFVASDKDHMLDEINDALRAYDVKAIRMHPEDTHVVLSILGLSDHFIANCVSTFSHIVKRQRDYSTPIRPTSFFGFAPYRKKIDL